MTRDYLQTQWSTLCESAQANTSRLTQGACPSAAKLMLEEANRFCDSGPPTDKVSLEAAYTRRMALSARLTAIARADAMARKSSEAAPEILTHVCQFCEGDLPDTSDAFLEMQLANIQLTRTIAKIYEGALTNGVGANA